MAKLLRVISRKHPLETQTGHGKGGGAELEKCLTTLDLISLGVGSCCGAGMYLTAGIIASQKAGPGGVISMCIAGLISVLTGFHYAELAGICPHTSGSAYMYAYVTVGELSAFVIGWGLIVEYVIGTAAAAVALSETFHSVTNNEISGFINSGMDKAGLPHVDFVAALVCLLLTWLLASGVQMSARVNNVLNGLNFLSWAVFVGASYSLGSRENWTDHGGFLPFGYKGVFSAIPTAYYAFVGFDGLATTGAECKTPIKSIPISVISSIIINIVIFSNVILGLTLNVPYSLLPPDTAMLDMFAMIGYPALKYVVALGAVSGLFAATFGSLFPLPRVLQAMARDGLFFRWFAYVCPKRHTALRATVLSGLVATFLAAFVKLTLLIELVLIGTLLAYVIVTFITLVIRFVDIVHVVKAVPEEPNESVATCVSSSLKRKFSDNNLKYEEEDEDIVLSSSTSRQFSRSHSETCVNGGAVNIAFEDDASHVYTRRNSVNSGYNPQRYDEFKKHATKVSNEYKETSFLFSQPVSLFNVTEAPQPSKGNIFMIKCHCVKFENLIMYIRRHVIIYLLLFYGCLSVMCAILANLFEELAERNFLVITCLAAFMIAVTVMAVLLMFIPHVKRSREGFHAPCVPLLTVITAGVNLYLMTSLTWITWLLFLAWLIIGLSIYIFYGTKRSSLNTPSVENSSDLESIGMEMLNIPSETRKESAPLLHPE